MHRYACACSLMHKLGPVGQSEHGHLQDARLSGEHDSSALNPMRTGVAMGVGLPAVWQGGRAGVIIGQVFDNLIHGESHLYECNDSTNICIA